MCRATALIISMGLFGVAARGSYVSSMPPDAQGLFQESISWLDGYYDPEAGYLYDLSSSAALRHETRSSAWYAVGLLARNKDDDVANAEKIITNIIAGQYKVKEEQWFGDYQKYPEEPYVGSTVYQADIYDTWDPNWRGFISTTFIVGLEEFGHLISQDTTALLIESLRNATIGDSYRVGGVNDDNLYPAYSNPSIMRAFTSGWTGRRLNDANMTSAGEEYAQEIINLFNRAKTLSEFNSGTYTGVSLWALSLWAKYLPDSSIMKQNGPRMMKYTWEAVGQIWHPQLKNMAGPWDRSYGYDMNKYFSLMALHFWSLIGKSKSSLISRPQLMSHNADFAFAPLFAILAKFQNSLVPANVTSALTTFSGEHIFKSSTYSPPYDYVPRNITTWLADSISIGAESFDENVVGGPAINPETFNPALIQWDTGNGVGFITLYATESALDAMVTPGKLSLAYPNGNTTSQFSLLVSTFKNQPTISGWNDIQGLSVSVSGNVDANYTLGFAGENGGSYDTINDFEFWNFTYSMPDGFTGVPKLTLDVALT